MQNLTFDAHGYLTPSEKITIDLNTLEQVFVKDFPNSETRKGLFDNYLRYVDAFAKEITPHFTQWINGSFVTQKENPKDIDVVTFIDINIFEKMTQNGKLHCFYSFAWEKENIDAYIVEVYPEKSPFYLTDTFEYRKQWHGRFRQVKENPRLSKGYLQLKNFK